MAPSHGQILAYQRFALHTVATASLKWQAAHPDSQLDLTRAQLHEAIAGAGAREGRTRGFRGGLDVEQVAALLFAASPEWVRGIAVVIVSRAYMDARTQATK